MSDKNKRHKNSTTAAVEIGSSDLHLAVYRCRGADSVVVRTASVRWRNEAASLHSEAGRTELAQTLKRLASEYGLQGRPLMVTLNGDYCVTRVVTGTAERVRHELEQLEDHGRADRIELR